MSYSCRSNFLRISLLALGAALTVTLTGCGIGTMATPNGTDAIAAPITGIIHGGPNPVVGAQVILYTTGSSYGVGNLLQEASQTGTSAHQDTSSTGSFSFAGGYTCPANSYAYVVAYGGNSGSGTNPNSVLMAALGPCANLTASTYIWIDELTTVAAGYALSNFINITYSAGTTATGFVVGVGADATNSAAVGCVVNAYYPSCTTTTAAGMAHAFTMAGNLVSTSTGQVTNNGTTNMTANGAVIPAALINTLANIIQSCVNSTGGGTSAGVPTTTTTSSGTTYDGTVCGALSAFTSYTSNGTSSGTLNAAGTTLGFIQNLAKRPGGSNSTFASTCASGSTGSTTAATCIFNLAASTSFYQTAMTAAPPDWMLAIYYPKGSFSSATNATTGCTGSPTTLGTLYPFMLATDINDNVDIINGDASANVCMNVISIGFDGTPIGATAFDNTGALLNWVSNDSFGHTIVPVHNTTTGGATNGVRIYSTGTDSTINLLNTYESATTAAAGDPLYTGVDQNDTIWIAAQNGANDLGWLTLSGSNSHTSPAYTGGVTSSAVSTSMNDVSIDVFGNVFSLGSASTGTERVRVIAAQKPSSSTNVTEAASGTEGTSPDTNTTSNGLFIVPDTAGNTWTIATEPASTTATQGGPIADLVFSTPYTSTSGVFSAFGTASTEYVGSTTSEYDYTIKAGAIDGNSVAWWADLQGSSSVMGQGSVSCTNDSGTTELCTSYLHGFDTVNKAYLPVYFGCEFTTAASTACGSQPADTGYPSSAPYALYGVHGLAVDSAGNIWTANGTQGHITEIIGMAAPTWPMFIHNGSSNKP